MALQVRSEAALTRLIDPAAEPALLGGRFEFSEGPVWNARENRLYFHDIPGDARWRWSADEGLSEDLSPTFKGNGMAYDLDGNLLVCEQTSSCVSRYGPDGRREVIASHFRGEELNSPNDVVARASDGSIYFTDPDYGRWNDWIGLEREPRSRLGFKGLYRLPPGGGEPQLVVEEDEFDEPNGLCFSPDETLMYVNDSPRAHVKVFDVAEDGSLVEGRMLYDGMGSGEVKGGVDGMECDEHGNVWTTGPGGVWIITPAGELLGLLETSEVCGSLAWGGPDLRTLFLTTTTTLHAVPTLVRSARVPGNH
jgi:gluconolactonase